jgi:hypothetical protein
MFQNSELLGFWTLPIVRNSNPLKLDLFSSSDEGKKTPTLLDPLERANLNDWTQQNQSRNQ